MIDTFSKFYFIDKVDVGNFYVDFNEGLGPIFAEVESGSYSPTNLAIAVQAALNDAGTLDYTVTFNRSDRTFTISANANFSLLTSTGVHLGEDIFSLIGFFGSDKTGASTYTGSPAAEVYSPQFKLQDYVDIEDLQKSVSASVNKSASGLVEVVKFGVEKFFEFNIMFATDIDQGGTGPIRTNLNGVNDLRNFMRFAVNKTDLEFMPDESNLANYFTVLLESTEEDRNGTGYRLKEMYSKGLPYYYETGKLVFRLVE